ncbi:hypothetical protein PUN28_014055 [Cardiocondyla obscurior]|uniref:Uncharacterized protein n=1 Tax=Cardiocondyla obscurior TaxID=286306 RepID=A0AAW2F7I0_9HYME
MTRSHAPPPPPPPCAIILYGSAINHFGVVIGSCMHVQDSQSHRHSVSVKFVTVRKISQQANLVLRNYKFLNALQAAGTNGNSQRSSVQLFRVFVSAWNNGYVFARQQ